MRFVWLLAGYLTLVVMDAAHDTDIAVLEWGSSMLLGGVSLFAIGFDSRDRQRRKQQSVTGSIVSGSVTQVQNVRGDLRLGTRRDAQL